MPTPTLATPVPAGLGAGFLFRGPLGSALPANTVAGGVFTDPWPGAWILWGATDAGTTFTDNVKASAVEAAEYPYPIAYDPDGSEVSIAGALLAITATNLKAVRNGGNITVTGSGATQLSAYAPPALGQETRQLIGWESRDSTERVILYQAFQVGQIGIKRGKGGANKATLPFTYMGETPSSGILPYGYWTAGPARG